jgi:glycosyltransferase involved in cell wall biosynthesis
MDKNSSYLISIILPVYNGELYLAKSIDSCLGQTHKNIELIVVDDASQDSSLSIAKAYAKHDKRVRIIQNEENKKLPASLNIGHKVARGRFITWTSHDNFYASDAIDKLLNNILKENADICFSDFTIIDEEENTIGYYHYKDCYSILMENIVRACFLYKKTVFETKAYDEELFKIEDYAFWLMASRKFKFSHLAENLYSYRIQNQSLTAQKTIRQFVFKEEYNDKVRNMYFKFFKTFETPSLDYISTLFKDLHLHQKIDVLNFLKRYTSIIGDISQVLKIYEERKIIREIDIRIRANILRYEANQNIQTLMEVFKTRPQILFSYSRRKSLKIIEKCIFQQSFKRKIS